MTLKNDLSRFTQKTQPPNPYEKVFLLKNPFPGPGETSFEVCSGQEEIKDRFIDFLQDFSQDTKRLRINGKNGAGKTNILRYFEKLTDEARRNKLTKNLHPIYVYAPGETYFAIHEQIVDKLAEFFFNDLLRNLKENRSLTKNLASNINAANEILAVINAMIQPMYTSFPLLEERQRDAFIRWLKAQKLTAGDKKLLSDQGTPPAEITSPSLAMRFLYGFLEVLKVLGLSEGIVLLFDEFEEIFEGLTRSRQSQYAQNLRHFFDILKESVFFCSSNYS